MDTEPTRTQTCMKLANAAFIKPAEELRHRGTHLRGLHLSLTGRPAEPEIEPRPPDSAPRALAETPASLPPHAMLARLEKAFKINKTLFLCQVLKNIFLSWLVVFLLLDVRQSPPSETAFLSSPGNTVVSHMLHLM